MFFNQFGIKSRNINLIGIAQLVLGFIFLAPVFALFLQERLFSVTNVAIFFAIQTFTTSALEVPTGAIADLFGRKGTYALGMGLSFAGLLVVVLAKTFPLFIVGAILLGTSGAFISGAYEALLYDTLKSEKKEKHFKKIMSIMYALWPLGAVIGSAAGGFLAKVSLTLPVALSLIPVGIAFVLSIFVKEPQYEQEEHKNIFHQMAAASKAIIHKKQLLILILIGLVMLALGESMHVIKPIFLEAKEIPVEFIGIIYSIIFGLSSFGHYISHFVSEKIGNKNTIIMSVAVAVPLLLLAVFTKKWVAALFIALPSITYGLRNPVMSHLLNEEAPSAKRATILSINNLFGMLGFSIVSPFLGYLADLYSINTAFLIIALMMIPAIILGFFLNKN